MVAVAVRSATGASLGFASNGIYVTDLFLKQPTNSAAGNEYVRQLMTSVGSLPGVGSVALTSSVPFRRTSYNAAFAASGSEQWQRRQLQYVAVSPNLFATLQIKTVCGREFTYGDNYNATKVAVLNEAAAQMFFGNNDALHKELKTYFGTDTSILEVVGVVGNIRQDPTTVVVPPIIYIPMAQAVMYSVSFVLRADAAVTPLDIKARIWSINANQVVEETEKLADLIDASLRGIRYMAFLMTLFAVITMFLSGVGIYATVAQWLSTSQKEIALHLVLGATYHQIRRTILARIIALTVTALAIGIFVAFAGSIVLKSLLYGAAPRLDAVLPLAVSLVGAIALLCGYAPTLRSKFIAPAELLRSE
jgi:putative ABC transport system permease protein